MALRVCPSCSRHAREVTCPFCGTEISQVGVAVTVPRVSRAGLLGIAATAVVVGACSTAQPAYGIAIPDADDAQSDAPWAPDALYGGPPYDASNHDSAPDTGSDSGTQGD